jgi:hypothetical protein
MGDGVQKKYALIINGDTEPRHLENVDRAIHALRREEKYQISVASTQRAHELIDHFATPDLHTGLEPLIQGLKSQLDDDDLLVVYVTGHGEKGTRGEGCVSLPDGCFSLGELEKKLRPLPYGKRIVVMESMLFWKRHFFVCKPANNHRDGGLSENSSVANSSALFWADRVPDLNGDGVLTVSERYAYALSQSASFISSPILQL